MTDEEADFKLEDFLGLNEDEIERRMTDLEKNIPTTSGIGYLETRLKIFEVQPWPFISYLANYDPTLLSKELESYEAYDGGENSETIKEMLREKYIIEQVLEKISG